MPKRIFLYPLDRYHTYLLLYSYTKSSDGGDTAPVREGDRTTPREGSGESLERTANNRVGQRGKAT